MYIKDNCEATEWHNSQIITMLTLWRPLLPYGYSYKASCGRLG